MLKDFWTHKRGEAVERFYEAWEKADSNPEPVKRALDTVAIAHFAARLECDIVLVKDWEDAKAKAMERVVEAWTKLGEEGTQEEYDALNKVARLPCHHSCRRPV